MKEFTAYIKELKEDGELGDAIGTLLIGIGGYFAVVMTCVIFG